MQTLVFTAKGAYARFRCPHTTTSALTFLSIHPIAVKGLIGAVLGVAYDEMYEHTKNMKIGIQVLNPVYKDTQSFNLIAQTNNNKAANFQSRVQFLRDVKYRIFVSDEEEKLQRLMDALQSHEYVFTPYLGCSEHIAKLEYEDMLFGNVYSGQSVDTLVPKEYTVLDIKEDLAIYIDRIPIKNAKDREYLAYSKIVFGVDIPLQTKDCEIYRVGERNVFFF
ncbi:type I-B CRISPR-associated protein Cas5b [Alkaliphilus peptidifermentans]|uniref:CRISPR-associated protein, Cas5h family n=1 Tax=Alkaliphilus peptidifermentans DSM 18978 TaxID=1120976 RepID=A0A1G5IUJ0_9FIRM|nr:type I-B CRISPR-associated protein Cas5b [Alkaliphilus peptidifermentans]SCY79534.1 CRISPR-associated protein, Cas5h family [Alkaliphilus peptidifermentans DSM 18978]